jgi:hypothetical protein
MSIEDLKRSNLHNRGYRQCDFIRVNDFMGVKYN